MTSERPTRRIWTLLAGLVLGLAGVLVPAGPASAHAVLVSSSPQQSSVVQEAPTQVVLTFSETVKPIEGKVKVVAPDSTRADSGDPRVSGDQLIIPLKPGGARGTYLVNFRVVSSDGHPVGGAFTYSVGAPSATPTLTDGDTAASPVVTAAFPVVRWVGYVGLLLLVGAVLVLALLWPQRLDRAGPTRVIWLGAAVVAVSTLVELVLEVPYVAGGGLGDVRSTDIQEVMSSQFGTAHLIRLGVLVAALLLVRPIVRGKGWGADRVLLAVLGTIGIATWSVSGHPGATPVPMVTVVSDMIHIASMSVWLGGLVMLIVFLVPRSNAAELAAIIPVWSRWATYAVAALVLTGIAQALVEVGTVDVLFSTTYGWLVVAKLVLVAVLLGIASISRRLVTAVEQRVEGSAGRLRGIIVAEAAVAAVVLGVTSVLVQTPPARTASAEATTPPTVQSAVLRAPLYVLTVDMQPAAVGINELHLYAATLDGLPADIKEWKVRASLPSQGIEPIDVTILRIPPDHAIGQISLPAAGSWTFTFSLRTTDIDEATVTQDFTVTP